VAVSRPSLAFDWQHKPSEPIKRMSLQLSSTLARALLNIELSLLFLILHTVSHRMPCRKTGKNTKIETFPCIVGRYSSLFSRDITGMRSLVVPSATPISVFLFFLFCVGLSSAVAAARPAATSHLS
jgi:hypothetical protein